MKTEQLKELVARLRDLLGDWTIACETADALSAIIVEREKAEPVAIAECRIDEDGHTRQWLNRTRHGMNVLKDGDKLYTSPPDLESLRHNLAVTTDTMRQFEELAARRLVEIESIRARVAELEAENADLDDKVSELENPTWPEWDSECLKIIRKHSGYDGFDDQSDGVDLPRKLAEQFGEYESTISAQAEQIKSLEEKLAESERNRSGFANLYLERGEQIKVAR